MRTYLRKFEEALASGDAGAAKSAFVEAQSELMRAVTKGVVHKNTEVAESVPSGRPAEEDGCGLRLRQAVELGCCS